MLKVKSTNIFSEIGAFFSEKDDSNAINAITALQYNILDTVKRFKSYETIGGLFHQATDGVVQLPVAERIWGVLGQNHR